MENSERKFEVEVLPDEYSQYDLSFKVIVIGDSGVGKSCLTTKAVKNNFEEYYQATIGFEFLTFNVKLDQTVIKLQIWDTCGQEVYRSLISNFYRNSSFAVMVYAINDVKSYQNIGNWLEELKSQSNPDVRIMLVGNKSDLEDQRQVSTVDAEEYTKEHKIDKFLETSAKTGFNTKNVLIEAAKILYLDYLNYQQQAKKNKTPGSSNIPANPSITPKGASLKDEDDKEKKPCCG